MLIYARILDQFPRKIFSSLSTKICLIFGIKTYYLKMIQNRHEI